MPDPLEGLTGLINQMEFIGLVMGNYAQLNAVPKRVHDYLLAKKADYGSNMRHAEHLSQKMAAKLSNEGIENIKNNEDPSGLAKEYISDIAAEIFEVILK